MSGCDRFISYIQSALNEPLDAARLQELEEHLAGCHACREYRARTEALRTLLTAAPNREREVPQRLKNALHLKLVEAAQHKPAPKPSFFETLTALIPKRRVFIPALCAFFAVIAGLYILTALTRDIPELPGEELISRTEVPEGRPVTVTLEYIAARDIPKAQFTVALDEGLSFYSDYAEIHTIKNRTWNGSLKKGVNTIPFVVKVAGNGTHTIQTRADFEGYSHSHKIVLDAGEGKVVISYFKLPDMALGNGTL